MHSAPITPDDFAKFPGMKTTKMIFSEDDPFGEFFPPKEAVVVPAPEGFPVEEAVTFFFKIKLDDGDLGQLVQDGHLWLSMTGTAVFPFDVQTEADMTGATG